MFFSTAVFPLTVTAASPLDSFLAGISGEPGYGRVEEPRLCPRQDSVELSKTAEVNRVIALVDSAPRSLAIPCTKRNIETRFDRASPTETAASRSSAIETVFDSFASAERGLCNEIVQRWEELTQR